VHFFLEKTFGGQVRAYQILFQKDGFYAAIPLKFLYMYGLT